MYRTQNAVRITTNPGSEISPFRRLARRERRPHRCGVSEVLMVIEEFVFGKDWFENDQPGVSRLRLTLRGAAGTFPPSHVVRFRARS